MRSIIIQFLLVIIILLSGCQSNDGVTVIKGKVQNSNNEFVSMRYFSKLRAAMNFDGFRSMGTRINKHGTFEFRSDAITEGAEYILYTGDIGVTLALFRGDKIKLEFDIEEGRKSLFATGKGAGKINVLRLPQFNYSLIYNSNLPMAEFKVLVDSIVDSRQAFLEAIYEKEPGNDLVTEAVNKDLIERIIKESPLSKKEYDFVKMEILAFKAGVLSGYVSYLADRRLADSVKIDFSDPYFDFLKDPEIKKITNYCSMNYNEFCQNLPKYKHHRYLQRIGKSLIYPEWNSIYDDTVYMNNAFNYIRDENKAEEFEYLLANEFSMSLNMGYFDEYLEYKHELFDHCKNGKYTRTLEEFSSLIETGLQNSEFDLGNPEKSLDSLKFNKIMEEQDERPIYLSFWSPKYSEAWIMPFLPEFLDFEKRFEDKLRIISVCVDEDKYKGLWAAKVIDNHWHGNHYFYPVKSENLRANPFIRKFISRNIFSLCDGECYSLFDKDGKLINNNVPSPRDFNQSTLTEFLNKSE